MKTEEPDRQSWDKGKQTRWGPRRAKWTPDLHSRSRKPVTMPKFNLREETSDREEER